MLSEVPLDAQPQVPLHLQRTMMHHVNLCYQGQTTVPLDTDLQQRSSMLTAYSRKARGTSTMRRATSGQVTVCIACSLRPRRALQK